MFPVKNLLSDNENEDEVLVGQEHNNMGAKTKTAQHTEERKSIFDKWSEKLKDFSMEVPS